MRTTVPVLYLSQSRAGPACQARAAQQASCRPSAITPALLSLPPSCLPFAHAPQGAVDTSFIAKHEAQLLGAEPVPPAVLALAAVTFVQIAVQQAQVGADCGAASAAGPQPWAGLGRWGGLQDHAPH